MFNFTGPGLAFIAYPQATALMPLPQFWTACFFLMLIFLSVDTHVICFVFFINNQCIAGTKMNYFLIVFHPQFVTVECFITSISDVFPKLFRKPGRHELLVLLLCLSLFLINLMLVTEVIKYISTIRFFHTSIITKYFSHL